MRRTTDAKNAALCYNTLDMYTDGIEIVLASLSPRRHALLQTLGLAHRVADPQVEETWLDGLTPAQLTCHLARAKGASVCAQYPQALVIAADTVVVCDGEILGKPASHDDARRMLGKLSDRRHSVITGVYVACRGREQVGHEETMVRFGAITPAQIDGYLQCGEPMDKAGSYGIQGKGAVFVQGIEGCYFNVVGLPLARLTRMMGEVLPGGAAQLERIIYK